VVYIRQQLFVSHSLNLLSRNLVARAMWLGWGGRGVCAGVPDVQR